MLEAMYHQSMNSEFQAFNSDFFGANQKILLDYDESFKNTKQSSNCKIHKSGFDDVMKIICEDLLTKTSGSLKQLEMLQWVTFVMFLISFIVIGVIRPKKMEDLEAKAQ